MPHLDRKLRVAAGKLRAIPRFESTALVTDDAVLAAQTSSLFLRPNSYFNVLDGPRIGRPDEINELVRRRNALAKGNARLVLIGGVADEAIRAIKHEGGAFIEASNIEDVVFALRGRVKRPKKSLPWGRTNLGVGLYLARNAGKELSCGLPQSPSTAIVERGRHLLVACERGNDLAEIIASNLAFGFNASFATFPELPKDELEQWVEDLYALGESAAAGKDIESIEARARAHLDGLDVTPYATVLWVTAGFPWGIALPATPSTHLTRYPDLGRTVMEGLWASRSTVSGSRTALLIDPGTVGGAEMPVVNRALLENGSLTQVLRDRGATVAEVQSLVDLLPYDIIVLSSHAGDASGERITYEYEDYERKHRRLVVDEAVGFGYDRTQDMVRVSTYSRFHSLDGVDWRDSAAKAALPVGSAIQTWTHMPEDRRRGSVVQREPIPRVNGSMGIQMHDGTWFFFSHGFSPLAAPLIVNNSCWSWHHLSERAMFAGARGYLGALRPILGPEAESVSEGVFERYLGLPLVIALWTAQRDTYDAPSRHPFVLVGLPCVAILPNTEDSVAFLERAIIDEMAYWTTVAGESGSAQGRVVGRQNADYLARKLSEFREDLVRRPMPLNRVPKAYA